MPAQSKVEMLDKISQSLEGADGVYVVDYRGLSVKEAQEFRRALREANAEMKVYKNNLVKLALAKAELPALDDMLVGTCGYIFYHGDPVAAAKVIKDEAAKLEKIEIKGGIADGRAIDAETAKAYADLPSREELIAKLVYILGAPLTGIAQVCAGPARGLATVLEAVASQKEAA